MDLGRCLGQGRTASVYEYGDYVMKLFYSHESMGNEATNTRIINELGIPSPKLIEVVDINGSKGIVFEKIVGNTMLKTIEKEESSVLIYAKLLAQLHHQIHLIKVNYPSNLKNELIDRIQYTSLSLDTKQKLMNLLDQLPEDNQICHFDFHPDNIIMSEKGPIVIDWANVLVGNALADVARTAVIMGSTAVPPGDYPNWLSDQSLRKLFQTTYLEEYFSQSNQTKADLLPWMAIVASTRLLEQIPTEKEYLIEIINQIISR